MLEKPSMSWNDFWHKLETKVYDEFEVPLSEVDEFLFNVKDYWNICKYSEMLEQMKKIDEALLNFQSAINNFGKSVLVKGWTWKNG